MQQGDFLFARQALQRIEQRVQRLITDFAQSMRPPVALLAHNAARRLGALLQRIQGDLIGIGEAGLLTADGAHADALIDIVRAILDDAVLDHPGFVIAGLEIEIGVVDTAFCQLTQYPVQVLMTQLVGSE